MSDKCEFCGKDVPTGTNICDTCWDKFIEDMNKQFNSPKVIIERCAVCGTPIGNRRNGLCDECDPYAY